MGFPTAAAVVIFMIKPITDAVRRKRAKKLKPAAADRQDALRENGSEK